MNNNIKAVLITLLLWLSISTALARPPALDDPLLKADFGAEHNHGATNAATGLGNGRMTVGVSPWSELVYLRWPSPGYYEQLRYMTMDYWWKDLKMTKDVRYSDDAPSVDWQRYGRPYEVHPGLGARGGVYLNDGTLAWFGDASWKSSRAYEPEWSDVLCTTLTRSNAEIKICQWVDWKDDLLVQDFAIGSQSAQKFFYYATFAPFDHNSTYKKPPDPKAAGFATAYLRGQKVILYFNPKNKDKNKIETADKFNLNAQKIDKLYPEGGYFIAMALMDEPDGFQVGADRKGNKFPKDAPIAASEEAKAGKLSGCYFTLGKSDSGLMKELGPQQKRVAVLVSAGKSASQAVAIIEKARARGIDQLRALATSDWKVMADRIDLPASAGPIEKRVARRSVLNLFVGRDRDTGAIVASPSRQPAYHFDWPRDGAFYDISLDMAGFPEIVDSHIDFYRRTQRRDDLDFKLSWLLGRKSPFYSPKGHWAPNIYTNGDKGRITDIPIEIDETGLLAWDLWRHEKFIPEPERPAYQKKYLEMLTLAADGLVDYVDVRKGWTKKVAEDDNSKPNATLHGAASVLAGLASAVDAGKRWGADPAKVESWRKAAIALREGMLRRVEDEKTLDQSGWRGIQWTLYPAPVFESYDDPRARKLIERLARNVEESAYKKRAGFAYLGEQVFILAIATSQMPEYQPLIEQATKILTSEVPMPGTDCFGEVTIWIDLPGSKEKVAQQRTSIPHLWTGVTSYLSVEARYRPVRFLSQVPPIPK